MPTTEDNLHEAFAGECQAFRKYMMFARKAEGQGFPNIARLFRTAAEAERIHAEGHMAVLQEVKSTAENLEAAVAGETHEYTKMYPPMLAQAVSEDNKAKRMFGYAVKAEEIHARLYAHALENAKAGKDMAESHFYLCPVCGHIEMGTPPATCPICGTRQEKFIQV
jgi:rubrerythrin